MGYPQKKTDQEEQLWEVKLQQQSDIILVI